MGFDSWFAWCFKHLPGISLYLPSKATYVIGLLFAGLGVSQLQQSSPDFRAARPPQSHLVGEGRGMLRKEQLGPPARCQLSHRFFFGWGFPY